MAHYSFNVTYMFSIKPVSSLYSILTVYVAPLPSSSIYLKNVLAVFSFIGYVALLLILIRYTNVVITLEGIFGIIISAILNYILLVYILNVLRKTEKDVVEYRKAYNKSMVSMILVLVPAIIIGIVLCFANWLPAFSFGMVTFWGVLLIALYNASVTRVLALNSINNKVKENKKDRKNKKEGTEK